MPGFSLLDLIQSEEDFERLARAARETDGKTPRWATITYSEFLRDYRSIDQVAHTSRSSNTH